MVALRVPLAAGWGGLSSLAIFWMLWTFINVPMDIGTPIETRRIEFTPQIVEAPTESKREEKIERELPPAVPETPRIGPLDRGVLQPTVYVPPEIGAGRFVQRTMLTVGSDRDAIPLVRVNPEYPPRALANDIEGWVQVQFSITATGMIRDAVVVASEPKNVFDEAALRALARWRYHPKVEGGVAVERIGLQTVIRFALDR